MLEAMENNINQSINETKKWLHKQAILKEKIDDLQVQIIQKTEQLSQTSSKIKLADMPEQIRYNRLKKERPGWRSWLTLCSKRMAGKSFKPYFHQAQTCSRIIKTTN